MMKIQRGRKIAQSRLKLARAARLRGAKASPQRAQVNVIGEIWPSARRATTEWPANISAVSVSSSAGLFQKARHKGARVLAGMSVIKSASNAWPYGAWVATAKALAHQVVCRGLKSAERGRQWRAPTTSATTRSRAGVCSRPASIAASPKKRSGAGLGPAPRSEVRESEVLVFAHERLRLGLISRHISEGPAQAEAEVLRIKFAIGGGEVSGAAAIGDAEAAARAGAVEAMGNAGLQCAVVEKAIAEFKLQILRDVEIDAGHQRPGEAGLRPIAGIAASRGAVRAGADIREARVREA